MFTLSLLKELTELDRGKLIVRKHLFKEEDTNCIVPKNEKYYGLLFPGDLVLYKNYIVRILLIRLGAYDTYYLVESFLENAEIFSEGVYLPLYKEEEFISFKFIPNKKIYKFCGIESFKFGEELVSLEKIIAND